MILTIEALQAQHGDSLILHYGSTDDPKFLVIDGGPDGVYRNALRQRLWNIRQTWTPDDPLPLSMLMVSHMDDDHVNGVLDLTQELRDADDAGTQKPFDVKHLWFNAFDDIIGNRSLPRLSRLGSRATVADLLGAIPELSTLERHIAAVIASTGQGRQLRDDAQRLTIPVNAPFPSPQPGKPPLVRADTADSIVDWGDGLSIHVLHPDHQRLEEMQQKWDADLAIARERGDERVEIAAYRDRSPFNLASIVALMQFQGKRMLLTGDARGDDIVDGLRRADLMDQSDHIHVHVLKLPHHGSDRNVSREFFEQVTADHYIISGNGEHNNPDKSTLVMLSTATRGNDDFTIHLTNHEGKHGLQQTLDEFIEDDRRRGRAYRVKFRRTNALSLTIDLLDQLNY